MIPPARWRRWILASAPAALTACFVSSLLIPPATLGWLMMGAVLLPRARPPYPHKKRPMLHRLFFAWAAGNASAKALLFLMGPAGPASWLSVLTALSVGCLDAVIAQRAVRLPLSRAAGVAAGAVLTVLFFTLPGS